MSLQVDKWPEIRAPRVGNYRRLVMALLGVLLVSSLLGCASEQTVNPKEIYIPVLGDATWLKADGAFLGGVQLAVQELNQEYASKGYTIKTEVVDDLGTYDKGVEMAARLSTDKAVTAVLDLQNFDVSKTTAGMLSECGKPVFFPYGSYDSLMSKGNRLLYCSVPSFADLGTAMANYAVKKGYKRIAVYHNGKASQEELVTAFELALLNTGTTVVDYVPSIASENEFDDVYSRWQALGVDCVVLSQYGLEQAFEVLKMLRSRNQDIPVLGEPIFNRANALAENRAIAEGMVVPSTLVVEDSEKLRMFKDRYKNKYGKEADIWTVQGYDMMRLVVDTAVETGSTDSGKLSEIFHESKGYDGVGGNIAFLEGGALTVDVKALQMLVCRNGRFEAIKN